MLNSWVEACFEHLSLHETKKKAIFYQKEKWPNLNHDISTSDNVETIEQELYYENPRCLTNYESHVGVFITSIMTEFVPVIEEKAMNFE